jgi:hypothetical protein
LACPVINTQSSSLVLSLFHIGILIGIWLLTFEDNLSVKQSKNSWTALPLNIGLISCLTTLVTSYQSVLHNIPRERRPYFKLHVGRCLAKFKHEDWLLYDIRQNAKSVVPLQPWKNWRDLGIINGPHLLKCLMNVLHFFKIIIWLSCL